MTEPDRTKVASGELLNGVCYTADGAETHTVIMRSHTGTVRFIRASHRFDRLTGSPMPTTR